MPKKLPPKEKRFKPGQSGNPGGRPKLPEDIKKARQLNQVEFERAVNRFLYMTREEMQATLKDPATPMIEIMIGSIMAQGAQKGDQLRLEFVLNRIIGKVQDRIEVKTPEPFVVHMSDGGQVVMGARLKSDEDLLSQPSPPSPLGRSRDE